MKINRRSIKDYYESLIDDAGNPEELLNRLEEIDDMLFELEHDIEQKIEAKDTWCTVPSLQMDREFMYANRMC